MKGLKLDPKTDIFKDDTGGEITMEAVKNIMQLLMNAATDMLPRKFLHITEKEPPKGEPLVVCDKKKGVVEMRILFFRGRTDGGYSFNDGVSMALFQECWWAPLPKLPPGLEMLIKDREAKDES